MKKKYIVLGSVFLIIVLMIIFFEKKWVGKNYHPCFSQDQCECGADGFQLTISFGKFKIPYFYKSCLFSNIKREREHRELEKEKQQKEEEYHSQMHDYFKKHPCDYGWKWVKDHCEKEL